MNLTPLQLTAFMRLANALSPENLHCDGEISNAEAKRKERKLKAEWRALERQHGVLVTEDEVWSQYTRSHQ